MAEKIEMPQLSDTMESGKIVKWFVAEGDTVERGDVLAEVETDKATMDLEAFNDGVLLKKVVQEGDEAPTQSLIAVIGEEGEDVSGLLEQEEDEETEEVETETAEEPSEDESRSESPEEPEEPEAEAVEPESEPSPAEPPSAPSAPEPTETKTTEPRTEDDGRLRASPVARRMAAKNGIDLRAVEGSGPEGRVVKKDVQRAIEEGTAFASVATDANLSSPLREEEKPLSGMRKTIAKRMTQAKRDVPHFYLEQDVDMDAAVDLVESMKDDGRDVSLNDFILFATARSLCEVPRMNSSYREDHVKLFGRVDLGFAVAVEDGLYTPVIEGAETKSVERIHEESQELIAKAREGDLKPEEYQGATFTVSNLGMFDITNFSAVINPPEAGILAVGAVEERPVAEDGTVEVRNRMSVTLSCDHRAVDGAIGARYLQAFTKLMENPARIFMG